MNSENMHGGNIYLTKKILNSDKITDFSANINPFGVSEKVKNTIINSIDDISHYPDPECNELKTAISDYYSIKKDNIICSNGADDIIYRIFSALSRLYSDDTKILIPVPVFSDYINFAKLFFKNTEEYILKSPFILDNNFITKAENYFNNSDENKIIVLCNPSNPTGLAIDNSLLTDILDYSLKNDILVILDECFIDMTNQQSFIDKTDKYTNLIVIRSFTKMYAIAGLRIGFAVLSDTKIIDKINSDAQSWSVNTLAQKTAVACLEDDEYKQKFLDFLPDERKFLQDKLSELEFEVFDGTANFIFFKSNISNLDKKLLRKGILIRNCANYSGLTKGYYRIAVLTRNDNNKLIKAIEEIKADNMKKAKSIMVVGTMSSAGKSFITAGLCRIFSNDGFETVPFKSQNMALNSYITADGKEMGRAQVMQAQASRKLPDVRMNPILLKPNSEKGSQIILNGKVYSQMNAKEYYRKKGEFIPHIKNAYSSLSSENDIIVLEGAGSPAEINLKDVDIVNMGMAKISDSPVILVADIDRGGVFASVYGTIMLLEEEERKRIKGIIINKFRGDKSILESGLTQIENLTGVPVLGVVPYAEIDLDDEDSLSERLLCNKQKENSTIDIAVIRLPRISNFTDFNIFERFEDVSIRYVSSVAELKNPDMLIIPGTKNTVSDLEWLRKNGLESKIMQYHEKGKLIFGICGGYQMLGNTIYYTEDDNFSQKINKQIRGIGLLDVETVNQEEKTTYQQKYTIENLNGDFSILSGTQINGYEIHMGVTAENKTGDLTTQFTFDKFGFSKGCCNNEENVFGTYIHGFFDDIADKIIAVLKKQKGIDGNTEAFDLESYKDSQYEKLDKLLRDNIDIQKIYEILENN